MALAIALAASVLAFPIAYFLAFRARARAPLFLVLLLVPSATSYLLRVMAWKLMLGSEGATATQPIETVDSLSNWWVKVMPLQSR